MTLVGPELGDKGLRVPRCFSWRLLLRQSAERLPGSRYDDVKATPHKYHAYSSYHPIKMPSQVAKSSGRGQEQNQGVFRVKL